MLYSFYGFDMEGISNGLLANAVPVFPEILRVDGSSIVYSEKAWYEDLIGFYPSFHNLLTPLYAKNRVQVKTHPLSIIFAG